MRRNLNGTRLARSVAALLMAACFITSATAAVTVVEKFNSADLQVIAAKFGGAGGGWYAGGAGGAGGAGVDYVLFPKPTAFDPAAYTMYVVKADATTLDGAMEIKAGVLATVMDPTITAEQKMFYGVAIPNPGATKFKIVGVKKSFTPQSAVTNFSGGSLGDWTANGNSTYVAGAGAYFLNNNGSAFTRDIPDYSAAGKVMVTASVTGIYQGIGMDVSIDGGANWKNVLTFPADGTYSADITSQVKDAAKNGAKAKIRVIVQWGNGAVGVKSIEITATP